MQYVVAGSDYLNLVVSDMLILDHEGLECADNLPNQRDHSIVFRGHSIYWCSTFMYSRWEQQVVCHRFPIPLPQLVSLKWQLCIEHWADFACLPFI